MTINELETLLKETKKVAVITSNNWLPFKKTYVRYSKGGLVVSKRLKTHTYYKWGGFNDNKRDYKVIVLMEV